jgi:hypothetical protein
VSELSIAVLFALALACVIAYAIFHARQAAPDRVARAKLQFLDARIDSSDPRYAFNGQTAKVVRELRDDRIGEDTTYVLTVYARTPQGEYFVFRSDGEKVSVRHLEHSLAKVVLKADYEPSVDS